MMKWRMLHRRRYLLIAVLAITLAAGTFTSTAYAKFRGPGVQAHNFSVTYVGITGPVDSLPAGLSDLVLTQVAGRFIGGRSSEMTVSMMTHPLLGTRLMFDRPCGETGDLKGLCIDVGRHTWVTMPQMLLPAISTDDTMSMWGPGIVKQVIDGEGYEGLATYRVTVESPVDEVTEGVIVTVNIDGYVSRMKARNVDHRRSSDRR